MPQEGNWNQVTLAAQQFAQVDSSSSVEFTGRLAIQLVCPNVYVILSSVFTQAFHKSAWQRGGCQTALLLRG